MRARQGSEGPDGAIVGSVRSTPHQDVVDSLYCMADALMRGNSMEEAEGELSCGSMDWESLNGYRCFKCSVRFEIPYMGDAKSYRSVV